VADPGNLEAALKKVASNRGAPGVDGATVEEVVAAKDRLLPKLRQALLSGTFEPGDIRRVWIPKPCGGQRGLGIPNVVDRWVQQSVLQVLEPIFEPTFHPSSHGFRPGRGARTALADVTEILQQGLEIVVDIDLSKFFDRVHHQRLLARVGQRVHDRRVLRLIHKMLTARVVLPDGVRIPITEGTPQGGPLSPLLSNIVLDELDRELERRGHRFVRYADDCQIFVGSERAGHRVMASIRRFIEGRLRLKVNEEKSAVALSITRHFLGFRAGRNSKGEVVIKLSKRSIDRLYHRIRELTPRNWGQSLDACFQRLEGYLRGWMGYFQLCTGHVRYFLRYADGHIRRRLRAIWLTQKRRPKVLLRALRQHGVSPGFAKLCALSHARVWSQSKMPGVSQALNNAWFAERITLLEPLWLQHHRPGRKP
jgi:group II intron reverse transcriptase/maturase